MMEYPFHPLANALPMLEGEAMADLVASIREHGLRDPITIYKGQILDGRNRYMACREAGVEPIVEELEGDASEDLLAAYVYDKNVVRRQLSDSQRAMAAARLLKVRGLACNADNFAMVAKQADVSPRTVQDAQTVISRAPSNVVDMVSRGEVAVSRAAKVVRGQIPESDLLPKPRVGRPVGNMHVQRLSNVLDAWDLLRSGTVPRGSSVMDVLVRHWPGDPAAAKKVGEMATWLRSLAKQLDEVERHVGDKPDTSVA